MYGSNHDQGEASSSRASLVQDEGHVWSEDLVLSLEATMQSEFVYVYFQSIFRIQQQYISSSIYKLLLAIRYSGDVYATSQEQQAAK